MRNKSPAVIPISMHIFTAIFGFIVLIQPPLGKPCFYVSGNLFIVHLLEHEMAVSGNSFFGKIDNRTISAVSIVAFHKLNSSVPDCFPESGGCDILRAVINIIAKIDDNGNLRLQQL